MCARVIRAPVPPEHFDKVLAATKKRNVPMVKQLPGFIAGYWSGDSKTGRVTTFGLLESEEGIRAAEAELEQMRPLMEPLGVHFDSVENLEVFVTEGGR